MVLEPPAEVEGRTLCGANRRQGEGTCKLRAGQGTNHLGYGRCKYHGGNTKTQRQAIEGQIIEARLTKMFGQAYEDTPVGNPLELYAEFTGKVVAWMRVLEKMVADLNSPGYQSLTGEQIRAEVQLFERAMDRCNTVLATYAKLNIDERLSRITEAQQLMVLQALEAGLAAADVTGPRALEARRAAAKRLRVADKPAGESVQIRAE